MKNLLIILTLHFSLMLTLHAGKQRLEMECEIPAVGKAVEKAVVVARIFEFDPRLADVAADEVAKVELMGIDLSSQKATKLHFPLQFERKSERSYYVTVFVYSGSSKQKRLFFVDGFHKIFEKMDTESLRLRLKEVKR